MALRTISTSPESKEQKEEKKPTLDTLYNIFDEFGAYDVELAKNRAPMPLIDPKKAEMIACFKNAIKTGDLALIYYLHSQGVRLKRFEALDQAFQYDQFAAVLLLLQLGEQAADQHIVRAINHKRSGLQYLIPTIVTQLMAAGAKFENEWFQRAYRGAPIESLQWIPKSDLAARDFRGLTVLHYACAGGHEAAIRILCQKYLEYGLPINVENSDNINPLVISVLHDQITSVKVLSEFHAFDFNQMVADLGVFHQECHLTEIATSLAMVEYLYSKGSNPGGRNPVFTYWNQAHQPAELPQMAEFLFQQGIAINVIPENYRVCGYTLLFQIMHRDKNVYSAQRQNVDEFKSTLIRCHADINFPELQLRSLLHEAVINNSLLDVYFLLLHGANVNAVDKWGKTPLFYAKSTEIADLLHSQQAIALKGTITNSNFLAHLIPRRDRRIREAKEQKDQKQQVELYDCNQYKATTPSICAKLTKSQLESRLKVKVDLHALDKQNRTALFYANSPEMVDWFVKHKCNVNYLVPAGSHSAIGYALLHLKNLDVVKQMHRHGAFIYEYELSKFVKIYKYANPSVLAMLVANWFASSESMKNIEKISKIPLSKDRSDIYRLVIVGILALAKGKQKDAINLFQQAVTSSPIDKQQLIGSIISYVCSYRLTDVGICLFNDKAKKSQDLKQDKSTYQEIVLLLQFYFNCELRLNSDFNDLILIAVKFEEWIKADVLSKSEQMQLNALELLHSLQRIEQDIKEEKHSDLVSTPYDVRNRLLGESSSSLYIRRLNDYVKSASTEEIKIMAVIDKLKQAERREMLQQLQQTQQRLIKEKFKFAMPAFYKILDYVYCRLENISRDALTAVSHYEFACILRDHYPCLDLETMRAMRIINWHLDSALEQYPKLTLRNKILQLKSSVALAIQGEVEVAKDHAPVVSKVDAPLSSLRGALFAPKQTSHTKPVTTVEFREKKYG